MRILLIASAFNGLSQQVYRELAIMGHTVSFELAIDQNTMIEAVDLFRPDVIICPYLKERIPRHIWKHHICLIVHPGIVGDRGPSSLDWAITGNMSEWGVTLLQAAEEMDAGDIWGTQNFPLREASKASLYRREVTQTAVKLIRQAINSIKNKHIQSRPLDYSDPAVKGILRPQIKQQERQIDWNSDNTESVIRKINAADSFPGVLDEIFDEPVYFYGARREEKLTGEPGRIIARCNDAFCKATIDGAVWIRMAKRKFGTERDCIKLPAARVLSAVSAKLARNIPVLSGNSTAINDIYWHKQGNVAYLYFDFYNGAMDTEQCRRLQQAYKALKKWQIKVIVLMGGEDFWGNGIQLNCIEAAEDRADESWHNINAMNDLVREIILSPKHITIAALRNNAGAGGAIMPLACDKVIVRDSVVLNPHYKTMGLYGSEYWTYLLPKRLGHSRAQRISNECLPMLATEALSCGFADEMFNENWHSYHEAIVNYAETLAAPKVYRQLIAEKNKHRKADERLKPLEKYRAEELAYMKESFFNPDSDYHYARYRFVHKKAELSTPLRLATHRKAQEEVMPLEDLAPCV